MSTRPSNRRAVLSSTVRQPIPSMCIFVPSGIERDAATVRPSTGLRPLAVMPVAPAPQHLRHAQYAVIVSAVV